MPLAPVVSVLQSTTGNGVATPATAGPLTFAAGNMLLCAIAVLGTSPTIAVPTGGGTWNQVQLQSGATQSAGLYLQFGNPGGAITASAVLGGTVTGWIALIAEFAGVSRATGTIASASQTLTGVTNLSNVFAGQSNQGVTLVNELFLYMVARATATITPQNTILNWSPSINAIAGVQGLSMDMYFAVSPGPSPFPQAAGILSAAVTSKQLGAWLSTDNAYPLKPTPAGGPIGGYVPLFYQGTIGG